MSDSDRPAVNFDSWTGSVERRLTAREVAELRKEFGNITLADVLADLAEARRLMNPRLEWLPAAALRQLADSFVICRDCDDGRTVAYVLRFGTDGRRALVAQTRRRGPFQPVALLDPVPLPGTTHLVCRRQELAVNSAVLARSVASGGRVAIRHNGTVC